MNIPNWFYDERVQKIAPEKLTLLLRLAEQLEGKTSQKEIMPVVMGAITSANRRNLMFSKEEFELIFMIMKEGKSEAEKAQMDDMLNRAQRLFSAQSQKCSCLFHFQLFFCMSINKLKLGLGIQNFLAVVQSIISRLQIADSYRQQNEWHKIESK